GVLADADALARRRSHRPPPFIDVDDVGPVLRGEFNAFQFVAMARFQGFAHQWPNREPRAARAEVPLQVLVAALWFIDVGTAFRVVTLGRLVDGHHDPVSGDLWDVG